MRNSISNSNHLNRRRGMFRNEAGVEVVEFAIVVPLFFLFLFGAIDMARYIAAYSAVQTATGLGARWATGISRPRWAGIRDIWASGDLSGGVGGEYDPAKLDVATSYPYFLRNIPASNWYQTKAQSAPPAGAGIPAGNGLYEIEMRAMAYAYDVLVDTLGENAVKYPCDTEATCAWCFTTRRDPVDFRRHWIRGDGATYYIQQFSVNMLGVECEYLAPLMSYSFSGGFLAPFVRIRVSAHVPVNDYANIYYNRD
jgi:hypothetical protein